jgi:transcriptional regulator with XRE-family HTH domain
MNDAEAKQLLGKRVRYLRRLRNLTQAKLAEKIELSVNYISEIENGTASPSFEVLVKLANILDTDMKGLFDDAPST